MPAPRVRGKVASTALRRISFRPSCGQAIDLLSMKEVGLTQTRLQFKARRASVAHLVGFLVAATILHSLL